MAGDDYKDRAILFIAGNNWHHALKGRDINASGLNYKKVAAKLVGPTRRWVETRYYVGQIKQEQTEKAITSTVNSVVFYMSSLNRRYMSVRANREKRNNQ